jgi:UDP-GlcNAc:undecaprenyl-phosphate GlcNAc-1-phosphate transferase
LTSAAVEPVTSLTDLGTLWLALPYALGFFISFATTLLLTPFLKTLARRIDVVDRPDARKIHAKPIPYLGGLGFYFAFLLSAVVCLVLFTDHPALLNSWDEGARVLKQPLVALAVGSLLVVLFGVVDDARGVRPRYKLLFQILVGVLVYMMGLRIEELSTPFSRAALRLDPATSFFVTVFWMTALMNAMNMIDGLDGLAAGISLIAAVFIFITAYNPASAGLECLITPIIAGAMLGFLRYNFHPASIFMGDTGSMLLGFLFGAISISSTQKQATMVALFVPMATLGLPVIEITSTFFRRLHRGQRLGLADREHLHYRLIHLGLSHRQVVVLMYYVSVFFGICAYLLSRLSPGQGVLVVILMLMGLGSGVGFIWHLDRTRDHEPDKNNKEPDTTTDTPAESVPDSRST